MSVQAVTSYRQLFLKDCGKFVSTNSKRTLRDNSCVQYEKEGFSVGILHKVILAGETVLAIVKRLEISKEKLCADTTTHAQIDDHYMKVHLPRYFENINFDKYNLMYFMQKQHLRPSSDG